MDQHPIPQNVTGFQFKLIGAMTVKQFGYVAIGVIAAVIVYYLPLKGLFGILIQIILIPLFGASGAILAFLPIDGRPVDVMAGNFFRALFSPNQYVYHKSTNRFSFSLIAPQKKVSTLGPHVAGPTPNQQAINNKSQALQKILISNASKSVHNPQDAKETAFLKSLSGLQAPAAPAAPTITSSPIQAQQPTILPDLKTPNPQILEQKEEALKKQLEFSKKEEFDEHNPQVQAVIHQKTTALEAQVAEIHAQKQALEQEIIKLKTQLQIQQAPTPVISQSTKKTETVIPKAVGHVRSVPKELNKKMGILVSDTPNIISGMVKDSRNNALPNILVEIKDKEDNPVRAFKTNALGNFASATPLAPGTYTITLEDPRKLNTFDEIKITANGQIMLPIEIISYDKREELRKELFN